MKEKRLYAKDMPCCECGKIDDENRFFPAFDPDIPSYPYCRKHLDEVKFRLLIKIQKLNEKA